MALDTAIERPGGPLGLDDRVIGRITAIVPAMAGAFVALPGSEPDGFLPNTAGAAGLAEGTYLALRVTRGPQGGKGCRLAAWPDPADGSFKGPPRLLARGPGAVERLASLHPDAAILVDRPGLAAALPQTLRPRVSVGLGDEAGLAQAIWAALAEPDVTLPNGARFSITPTPALTAIDVDTGSATAEKRAKKDAQLALNRAIIPAVLRHIRLRHLAGAILVDPAGLAQRQRPMLADDFHTGLAADPVGAKFLGFTALGLGEIQRSRRAPPLHELLTGDHAAGLEALAALALVLDARPSARDRLAVSPGVLGAIETDSIALEQFRDRTGRTPSLYKESVFQDRYRPWRLVTDL
ncbi:ribonuclease E/G [Acidisoma cellulosilytica]|uniref:Ribonuclease E/G n=1 Tax=Acidisoma cellulosilyticum TaxID=2802395 RepID=A0A963Z2G8_9PROT|nr:ribonuclease E/G [Acidisoma cellulosilyticum]MCB8880643.1 ribonuclease E/G [Acidisoma cellulosilyticum]